MPTQVKFTVDDTIAERFKRAVVEKRGKLALSQEGAKALELYLEAHEGAEPRARERDPLLSVIGIAASRGGRRPDARRDKMNLYE